MQAWRKANPEKRRAQLQRAYQRHKDFVAEQKIGKQCVRCGECDTDKLIFHHIDPATKLFEIAGSGTPSHKAVLAEIAKCEMLCKHCHASGHDNWKGNRYIANRDLVTGRFVPR